MVALPASWKNTSRRQRKPRRTLRCLLGKHTEANAFLGEDASRWHTRLRYCKRCFILIGAESGRNT